MLIEKANMPVIGKDSAIAKPKSCHKEKKVPKSLIAVEIRYRIPEFSAWFTSIVQERGVAINETTKRNKKPNKSLFVRCNSCSRLIAIIILLKRPAGGSAGLRCEKSFSKSCLIAPYILIRLRELFWFISLVEFFLILRFLVYGEFL